MVEKEVSRSHPLRNGNESRGNIYLLPNKYVSWQWKIEPRMALQLSLTKTIFLLCFKIVIFLIYELLFHNVQWFCSLSAKELTAGVLEWECVVKLTCSIFWLIELIRLELSVLLDFHLIQAWIVLSSFLLKLFIF